MFETVCIELPELTFRLQAVYTLSGKMQKYFTGRLLAPTDLLMPLLMPLPIHLFKHLRLLRCLCFIPLLLVAGCLGMPVGVTPVDDFDLQRYLGTWYEIARLDHSFERGLSRVTAEYSMRDDGGVRVLNRGWSAANGAWEDAEGRAFFVEDPATGYLKVSFFGPFYGSYVIAELEQDDYAYALISGPDTSYLWILARAPTLEPTVLQRLVARARELGFPTDELILVDQSVAMP